MEVVLPLKKYKKIFTSINLRNVINCNDNELFNINYEIKKKLIQIILLLKKNLILILKNKNIKIKKEKELL